MRFESVETRKELEAERGFKLTFAQFLKLYNFRYYNQDIEGCQDDHCYDCNTIRVKMIDQDDGCNFWFEFGNNDWSLWNESYEFMEKVFAKDLLNMHVESFELDYDHQMLFVNLV